VAALQNKVQALERRQAATTQDLRWRGLFGEKLSSWKQVIYRMSGGIDSARNGFQAAQAKQADFDALVTQLLLAAVTIGFAAGFEPLLTSVLMETKFSGQAAKIVEKVENPAVATVSAVPNIVGAVPKRDTSPPPAPGVPASTAVGYLSETLGKLEGYSQQIEHAFAIRASTMAGLSDEAVMTLDAAKQESIYQGLMDELEQVADGAEKMKPAETVSAVLERHLWAAWLKMKYLPASRNDLFGYEGPDFADFGSYIEDRLNQVGVSGQAGVELTGHWYSSNSSDYVGKLMTWAGGYRGSVTAGGPD
jgi:hypothetical protein